MNITNEFHLLKNGVQCSHSSQEGLIITTNPHMHILHIPFHPQIQHPTHLPSQILFHKQLRNHMVLNNQHKDQMTNSCGQILICLDC